MQVNPVAASVEAGDPSSSAATTQDEDLTTIKNSLDVLKTVFLETVATVEASLGRLEAARAAGASTHDITGA